jgi:hypothetical protein
MTVAWLVKPQFEYDVYTAAVNDGVLKNRRLTPSKRNPEVFESGNPGCSQIN